MQDWAQRARSAGVSSPSSTTMSAATILLMDGTSTGTIHACLGEKSQPQILSSTRQSLGRERSATKSGGSSFRIFSRCQFRNCDMLSTWSSWRPHGNRGTSVSKSCNQGARSGEWTEPASIQAETALIRMIRRSVKASSRSARPVADGSMPPSELV